MSIDLPELRKVCAVCGIPLDILGDGWGHISDLAKDQPDHVPVPVYADEITVNARCDVCNEPAEFTHRCVDLTILMPDGSTNKMLGNWGLCTGCHEAVLDSRWDEVKHRALMGLLLSAKRQGQELTVVPETLQVIASYQDAFRTGRTGEWLPGGYASFT